MGFLDSKEIKLKTENMTLESLKNLFDIELENPAAHAFSTDTTELPCIPKEISELYDDVQVKFNCKVLFFKKLYEVCNCKIYST